MRYVHNPALMDHQEQVFIMREVRQDAGGYPSSFCTNTIDVVGQATAIFYHDITLFTFLVQRCFNKLPHLPGIQNVHYLPFLSTPTWIGTKSE